MINKEKEKKFKMILAQILFLPFLPNILFMIDAVDCHRNDHIYQNIVESINPYRVMIFKSENFNASIPALSQFPNVILPFDKNEAVQSPIRIKQYKKEIQRGSLLILLHSSDVNDVRSFIDFFVTMSPVKKRPKCLVHLSSDDLIFKNSIKRLLKYAWEKKFLDFSIVTMLNEKNATLKVLNFNPFFDTFDEYSFDKGVNVFPDKLKDVNRYPILLPNSRESEPLLHLKLKNGKVLIVHEGIYFAHFILQMMNFEMKFKKVSTEIEEGRFFELESDFWPSYHSSFYIRTGNIVPAEDKFIALVAVVPIIPAAPIKISWILISKILIISLIVIVFIHVIRYIKLTKEFKEGFSMITTMLGQPVKRDPKKAIGRIIFLTLVMMYVLIINISFQSDVIDMNFGEKYKSFDTYQSWYDSNFEVITDFYETQAIIKGFHKDTDLKKLLTRVKFVESTDKCIDDLFREKNFICITFYNKAFVSTKYYRDSKGLPVMKIASDYVYTTAPFYLFSDGSPYTERFHELQRRVREAGLTYGFLIRNENRIPLPEPIESKTEEKYILKQLLIILFFGFIVSTASFFIELSMSKIKSMLKYLIIKFIILKIVRIRKEIIALWNSAC